MSTSVGTLRKKTVINKEEVFCLVDGFKNFIACNFQFNQMDMIYSY